MEKVKSISRAERTAGAARTDTQPPSLRSSGEHLAGGKASTPPATAPPRRNWKRLQPTSLRQALELCKEHARERRNMSVERIADAMGIADHWVVYKWIQNGRIPANLIRPYEIACGIDYATRWIAASSGRLLIDIPSGRPLNDGDVVSLHNGFGDALQLLTTFYANKADSAGTIAALTAHLAEVAWHRENVAKFIQPELDLAE